MIIQTQLDTVYSTTVKGITFYRARVLDAYAHLTHAIFTRTGGFSHSPYESLNLSHAVGDSPQLVTKNMHYACQTIRARVEQTVSSHLVHGADVLKITSTNQQQIAAKADGLITNAPGLYLFMRFGDCTPLLFFDPVQNAVGLTHAGWRGTMQNAAGATVTALTDQLGCRPENIMALIGPAIGPCCYEVGPDVIQAATGVFSNSDDLFRYNGRFDRAYFNLWAANRRQLAAAGVEQIIESGLCTACRTDEFFSHRAERGRTGRFGVIIGLEAR